MDHPASASASGTLSKRAWPPATWPSKRRRSASPTAASRPQNRSHHRRHCYPRHVLSRDRLPRAGQAGRKGRWGFDLSAACSGFVYALQVGAKLVESGAHSKVLVIGADTMSSIIDYTDRSTCMLFGDGAGAVLIEPAEEGELGMIDFVHEIDGSGACAAQHARRRKPATRPRSKRSTRRCTTSTRTASRSTNMRCARWSKRRRRCLAATASPWAIWVASSRTRRTSASSRRRAERLGLPLERVIINIDRYGNTTAGTIPLAMQTAREGEPHEKRAIWY